VCRFWLALGFDYSVPFYMGQSISFYTVFSWGYDLSESCEKQ